MALSNSSYPSRPWRPLRRSSSPGLRTAPKKAQGTSDADLSAERPIRGPGSAPAPQDGPVAVGPGRRRSKQDAVPRRCGAAPDPRSRSRSAGVLAAGVLGREGHTILVGGCTDGRSCGATGRWATDVVRRLVALRPSRRGMDPHHAVREPLLCPDCWQREFGSGSCSMVCTTRPLWRRLWTLVRNESRWPLRTLARGRYAEPIPRRGEPPGET